MTHEVVLGTQIDDLRVFKRGKVRDVYDLGEQLLIVSTDRISAFNVVHPTGIPMKGFVLTQLSAFWFEWVKDLAATHMVSADWPAITAHHGELSRYTGQLSGRSMLVKKTEAIPIECVVRGYLAGSGWKEYQKSGAVCGIRLPQGLRESDRLPKPIFTPAAKAETGHDLNITEEEMAQRVGAELTGKLKTLSLAIYTRGSQYAESRGIILVDTKFEFGVCEGKILLIDELLTPDSSRFWSLTSYEPGSSQVSFDKQYVRDYLEAISWDKSSPAPALPEYVVQQTSRKYLQVLQQLMGRETSVPSEGIDHKR